MNLPISKEYHFLLHYCLYLPLLEVLLELVPLDLVDVECGIVLVEDLETFVLVKTEAAGVV